MTKVVEAIDFVAAHRVNNHLPDSRHPPKATELVDFKSCYGIRPEVCVVVFKLISIELTSIQPIHLLWALCFLKVYGPSENVVRKICKGVARNALRKYVWMIIPKIAALDTRFVSSLQPALLFPFFFRLLLISVATIVL